LNNEQRNGLKDRFGRFLGLEEEEKKEEQMDVSITEEKILEPTFKGNLHDLIKAAYMNDDNAASTLRSMLLSKQNLVEIASEFEKQAKLHQKNVHLTLMITSCLKNVNVQGGNELFKYIISLYKSLDDMNVDMTLDDVEPYPMRRQLQIHNSHHLVQETLSRNPPVLNEYLTTPHRGLMADLITNNDPTVSEPSLSNSNDPYLTTLIMHNCDASQLRKSAYDRLKLGLNGLQFTSTVLELVEGLEIDENIVRSIASLLTESGESIRTLIQSKSEYLTVLLDSVLPKSLLDDGLEKKNKNCKALVQLLDRNSQLLQYMYCLAPNIFPQPDTITFSTKMDKFLHSLVLRMTDTDTRMSDFAFEMLRKCARSYPVIVSRYSKSIGTLLETENIESITATEIISSGLIKRYSQVLGIMEALSQTEHNLNIINTTLVDKFFHFIKNVILEVPVNHSYETPEQLQLKKFISLFLKFLQSHKIFNSHGEDITKMCQRFNLTNELETVPIHVICDVQSSLEIDVQDTLLSLEQCNTDLLPHIIPQLLDLLLTEYATMAYPLILRALQYDIRLTSIVIPNYLKCLQHHDSIVRANAVTFAYDMFPLCTYGQDQELLRLLFENKDGLHMISRIMSMFFKL
jgi:hypothetical protein